MRQILQERPSTPLAAYREEESADKEEESREAQGNAGASGTDAGQSLAGQADVQQQAGQVLPPMVFPGPLAFQPAPVMLPAPDAPNALASPVTPASLSALADAMVSEDIGRLWALIRSSGIEGAEAEPMPEEPPLLFAARRGHLGLVEALLAAGAQVNLGHPGNGYTTLIIAAAKGHVEIVKRLLAQSGIECDILNTDGNSALMLAAQNNHLNVVACLLDAGVRVNLAKEKTGMTALMFAAHQGHVEVVQCLLKQPGIERDKLNAYGDGALTFALRQNQAAVVDCLLSAGCQNDLPEALRQAVSNISASLVEVLFKHGAQLSDINDPLTNHPDWFVVTVEDLAAERNTSAPALPGPDQAQAFFNELIDLLGNPQKTDRDLLHWLKDAGCAAPAHNSYSSY